MVVLRPNAVREYAPETFKYRIVARRGVVFGGTWAFFRFLTDAEHYLERMDASRYTEGVSVNVEDSTGRVFASIQGEG